jgi:hypothetical protein
VVRTWYDRITSAGSMSRQVGMDHLIEWFGGSFVYIAVDKAVRIQWYEHKPRSESRRRRMRHTQQAWSWLQSRQGGEAMLFIAQAVVLWFWAGWPS